MPAKSALQFIGYEVSQLYYKKATNYIGGDEIQISPQFKKNVMEVGESRYDVSLGIIISGAEDQLLPFEICVELTGHFNLINEGNETKALLKQIINQNTVAILFPFLRSTVAAVTLAANISPVILPVINLASVFEEESKKQEEN